MNKEEKIFKIVNCRAYYSTFKGEVRAVDNISFEVNKNEILGIAGESGCGKSTLVKVLYGFAKPPLRIISGEINLRVGDKEENLVLSDDRSLEYLRWRYISYIPQASMSMLNPVMTIGQQFQEVILRYDKASKKELKGRLLNYIESFGLPKEVLNSYPHQLSGGMRQRVVIAMATFFHPSIVFADEPTTGLDVVVQRGIIQILRQIAQEFKITLIVVSHDMGIHYQLADRIIIMYAGKIVEIAPTVNLFSKPLHPYTRLLIEALPKIGDKRKREGVIGLPPSLLNPPSGCRFYPRCHFAMDVCRVKEPEIYEVEPLHFVACHLYQGRRDNYH
jgi:peptide/nickel transport system ATP-binding protein